MPGSLNSQAWRAFIFHYTVCFLQDIIGRHPDLMEGFNRFLARCETMDAVDNEMRGQFGSQRGIPQREMARLKGQTARWAAQAWTAVWLAAAQFTWLVSRCHKRGLRAGVGVHRS